jgi:DNA-binding response OmpR family regulator
MAKVIVIEDDHALAELLKEYLQELKHSVVIHYNPTSAIRHLKTEKFDALLTDINMTPINGVELIHEVRVFNKEIQIIAMSGSYSTKHDNVSHIKNEALVHGANSFLLKPFTLDELAQVMNA